VLLSSVSPKQSTDVGYLSDVDEREDIQKKTFMKWINARLSIPSQPITDLFDDLRDGTRLLALLEILTGIPLVSHSQVSFTRLVL